MQIPKRPKPEMMKLSLRVPDEVIKKLDKHIDGIRYRNRAQMITAILADWVDEQGKAGEP